jgi:hypothetical protein
MAFNKKHLGLAFEKQCENMLTLAHKTYIYSINSSNNISKNNLWIDFNNIKTTANKCKGYSKEEKLYLKEYVF